MANFLLDLWDEHFEAVLLALIGLLILGIIYCAVLGERQWNVYAQEHHCVAVGKREGSYVTTFDGKGGYVADQTVYQCEGGEIRIR